MQLMAKSVRRHDSCWQVIFVWVDHDRQLVCDAGRSVDQQMLIKLTTNASVELVGRANCSKSTASCVRSSSNGSRFERKMRLEQASLSKQPPKYETQMSRFGRRKAETEQGKALQKRCWLR